MQRAVVWSSPLFFVVACADTSCPDGQQRIGTVCVPDRSDDASAQAASDAAAAESHEDGGEYPEREGMVALLDASSPRADASSAPAADTLPGADASTPSTRCYLDRDGDGTGTGEPVDCTEALIASMTSDGGLPKPVLVSGDCDDGNPARGPSLTDICGDGIDNDCDGQPDDELNNVCGGPCTSQLMHRPGEPCSNVLLGACGRTGVFTCAEGGSIRCNAPVVTATAEVCDQLDNDCDGESDEGLFNECGGPCSVALAHKPGEPCSNGQLGACARSGAYVCQADATTVCNAPEMIPGLEKCGNEDNGLDDDCDGTIDEEETIDDIASGFLSPCTRETKDPRPK